MKVFKFGGASVKDAAAIKNIAAIIKTFGDDSLVIVISAMGKTTNALEKVVHAFYYKTGEAETLLNEVKKFHFQILDELFDSKTHPIYQELHNTFVEIEWQIEDEPVGKFDFEYDQMVGIGEMLSTKIVSAYLNEVSCQNKWFDVRGLIRTDNTYRNAKVDWTVSTEQIQGELASFLNAKKGSIAITQGFVGSSSENFTTTLGREGSDFTAAILANILDAEEITIWKDVEGMLNADPKYFDKTIKLNNISYLEAVELAYFGASVIHPKTIKPLQNKGIPLQVKSFLNPGNKGSLIDQNSSADSLIPSYIHKPNQILISIAARDYSFITEDNLSAIYATFSKHGVSINIMQNSAISFSVCVDNEIPKINGLIAELQSDYKVTYNTDLQLLTVRHYTEEIIEELIAGKTIFLEQKSRSTARFVVK
ncbi:MAG: aspartate kinase [Bacteroidetes bacterium]|nr:MAG: aspartate kinase [Bacteroidota bacterium]MBL1143892.1 aspartate kinase [Bacteroidota bacterium]MCB0802956.1 aspartate kinase [Flavobacteriales bacterium]NOG56693.1 aspartate kinase [Bacteroidota bacterium]